MKLWKKFGTEDDTEKGKYNVPLENQVEFFKEMDALGRIEVDLLFNPIALEKLEGNKLSGFDMASLDPFIEPQEYEIFEGSLSAVQHSQIWFSRVACLRLGA